MTKEPPIKERGGERDRKGWRGEARGITTSGDFLMTVSVYACCSWQLK
jgi:hypothetical protein